MDNVTEQIASINAKLNGLGSRVTGLSANPMIYAAVGGVVSYGCKVTEGSDDEDFVIALEGEAAGDEDNLNPDLSATPIYPFEFGNIASLKSGAFYFTDLAATADSAPGTGLGRYDIAFIYVGPTGPGFAVATGTPSTGTKEDYDLNGLVETPYDPLTDAALPVGALPLARIYVEDVFTGIQNARIADIRNFEGRLKGDPLTWGDLTPTQKDELIDPAVDAATIAVLADNEEFKRTQRTLFWLGV